MIAVAHQETVRLGALTTIAVDNLYGWNFALPADRNVVYQILEDAQVRMPREAYHVLVNHFPVVDMN